MEPDPEYDVRKMPHAGQGCRRSCEGRLATMHQGKYSFIVRGRAQLTVGTTVVLISDLVKRKSVFRWYGTLDTILRRREEWEEDIAIESATSPSEAAGMKACKYREGGD